MNEDVLRRLFHALNEHGVQYTLFGGLAVGAHGLGRTTKDVDLMLEGSPANARAAVSALRSLFDDPALDEITPEDLETYGVVRYGVADYDFVIDLSSHLGEAVNFTNLERIE